MITVHDLLIQEIEAAAELVGNPVSEARRKQLAGMPCQKLFEESQLVFSAVAIRRECEAIVADRRLKKEVSGDGSEKT